jgi:hypothetical protein
MGWIKSDRIGQLFLTGCQILRFCHNPTMMKMIVELLQATVLAALFFGPLFYYFLFVMQP